MRSVDRLTESFLTIRDDLLKFVTRRVGRVAAEDLLQDTWIRLHERGEAESSRWNEPRAVFFTTAANLATDTWRRGTVESKVLRFEAERMQADGMTSDPAAHIEAHSEIERLEAVLKELPSACREAFLLNRFEELTHAQIAERLGISTKSVQRHIGRALAECMRALQP